jgi:hypothetical protein
MERNSKLFKGVNSLSKNFDSMLDFGNYSFVLQELHGDEFIRIQDSLLNVVAYLTKV